MYQLKIDHIAAKNYMKQLQMKFFSSYRKQIELILKKFTISLWRTLNLSKDSYNQKKVLKKVYEIIPREFGLMELLGWGNKATAQS